MKYNLNNCIAIILIIVAILIPICFFCLNCWSQTGDFLLICTIKTTIITTTYPLLTAFLFFTQLNKPLKIFLTFCSILLILNLVEQSIIWLAINRYETLAPYMNYWDVGTTDFFSILYYLTNFSLLAWFYYQLLTKKYANLMVGVAIFLVLATLVNYLFIEGYKRPGVFNPAVDVVFSSLLPAFYLWYMSRETINFPLQKNPYFWISFGLMFSNLIALFLYITADLIQKENYDLFVRLLIIRNILEIIAQIFFAIGFWHARFVKYIPLPSEE